MKCTCSVWAAGLCCASLYLLRVRQCMKTAARGSRCCHWQGRVTVSRDSLCVCVQVHSVDGGLAHSCRASSTSHCVFLSFVYASLMLGGSEATRRARWKARQSRVLHSYIFATTHCCFYPFFCEWLFTEAARSLTWTTHSTPTQPGRKIKMQKCATDYIQRGFEMKCIPVLNRNVSNS